MNADCDSAKSDNFAGELGAMSGAPRNPPGFQRSDWLGFGATTLLALLVYLLTLGPSVGLDNSGVWSTVAAYGGVSSPPGYPLWTLWAWVFTKLLPFSNIAWRVAVSSAVAGALACGLIALMVSRGGAAILEQMPDHQRLKPKEKKWLRTVCGYAAGMIFGLNGAFWPQAVIIAVWPLSILLLCLVLCLLQRWNFQPESRRCLYAAALVYGLLLTNSQIEFAFAPAILFLVMTENPKTGRDMFLIAGVLFLAGLVGIWLGHFPSLRGQGGQFFIFLVWRGHEFDGHRTCGLDTPGIFGMEGRSDLRRFSSVGIVGLFVSANCFNDESADKLGLSPHGGRFLPRPHSRAIREHESDCRCWTLSRTGPPVFCNSRKGIWLALPADVPNSILFSAPNGCVRTSVDTRIVAGLRLPGLFNVGGVESKRGPAVSRAKQGIFLRIVYRTGTLDGLRTDNFGGLAGETWKAAADGSFSDLTAGDAELVHQFQFAPDLGAGDFAPQQQAVF
jgi:hypothetical protein